MGTLTSAAVKDRYTKLVWYNTSDNKLYKTTEDGTDADSLLSSVYLTGVRLTDNILRSSDGTTAITLDGASATISNHLLVTGEIKLTTDSEIIRFGEHGEVWFGHIHNTGLHLNTLTSLTNTSVTGLKLFHQTHGTPAAGIGSDMVFRVETSASNFEDGMKIAAITTDVSGGAEDFDYVLSLMEGGSGAAERMRVTSAGVLSISGDIKLPATKKLYLDGGGDTYFTESSANVVRLYTGSSGHYVTMTSPYNENSNTVYGKNAGAGMHSDNVNNTFIGDTVAADGTMTSVATNNTGVGKNALQVLTSGGQNTAVGTSACTALTEGNHNTAIGRQGLHAVTDGDDNTGLGWHAGVNITTGSDNICIGSLSQTSAVDTDNEIVIGREVTGLGANQIIIGNTSHTDMWISDQFNFDIANTEFVIHDDQDTGDLFSIQVAQHGATTIKTVDDDSHAADLTLDVDGTINLDSEDGALYVKNSGTSMASFTSNQLKLLHSADQADWFSVDIAASGATTISTVDDGAAVAHLNIEADGHVEFDGCGVGFDLVTPTYNAADTNVDFKTGNKQFVTLTGNIADLNLTFPATSGNFTLLLKQDGTGSRTIAADGYLAFEHDGTAASGSATVKFAGGSNPTLTTDANHVDILSFFWDADNQIAYGVATLNFEF